ncbi:MAG: MBL fold metallo-hydrolase [Deltaproteobacteria bacterium]|nr:MBL fold metallo-hydrolase [Deltaproteobacteria bacterium]
MTIGFQRAAPGPEGLFGHGAATSPAGEASAETDFGVQRGRILAQLEGRLRSGLSEAGRRELAALGAETDPSLFFESLLNFGIRQERDGRLDISAEVFAAIVGAVRERPLQRRAERELDALIGRGALGPRAEFLLRNLARQASEPGALFAMGAAGAVYRVTRLATLSRLAGASNPGLFTQLLGAGRLASLAGFAVEAPAFVAAGRLAGAALGHRQENGAAAWGREFASSYLLLGALRLGGWASGASYRNVAGSAGAVRERPLRALFQQTGMLTGILLGHTLEQYAGLRPAHDGATTLVDSLALLLQFHVAGNLSRRAFGPRFAAWERGLDAQAGLLANLPRPPRLGVLELAPQGALAGVRPAADRGSPIGEWTSFAMSASGRGRGGGKEPALPDAPPANTNDVAVLEVSRTTVPAERLRALPRGGVMVNTSQGWLQLGVPMWTNKDAFEIFVQAGGGRLQREEVKRLLPTLYVFDLDYVARHDGLLPADFMQYMYFITRGLETTLVTHDAPTARRLREFLDLSYLGPRETDLTEQVLREYAPGAIAPPRMGEEIRRGFPAAEPEALRKIEHLNEAGEFAWGEVVVRKLNPGRYEIRDGGASLGVVDLSSFPLPVPPAAPRPVPAAREARRRVLNERRPALWPIGTGHGFTPREETSGFMIWNRGKTVIVDPPSSTLEYFRAMRLPLSSIDGVLLTHGHTDHYGNAVPQLRAALPELKFYTTPTIFRMLQRQYAQALGEFGGEWSFSPIYPQSFSEVLGLHLRPEYSFHPVPTIGFEIYDRPDARRGRLVVSFTGDTFADHVDIWRHTQAQALEPPLLSVGRAQQILRHNALLMASKGQRPPPVFLIEGGVPPIHIPPARTRELLDQAEALGVDTSRVHVYHVAAEAAAGARVPKWVAGETGFFDLSEYFPRARRNR